MTSPAPHGRPVLLAGVLALSSACAAAPLELPAPDRRLASIGNLGTRSSFEIRTLHAAPDPAAPRDAGKTKVRAKRRQATPVLFYLGIVVAALAGGSAIATSAASFGLRRKLDNNYFTDGFTTEEYGRTVTNGDRLSKASFGLGFTAAAFAGMALIAYSVDWSRCGPLAPKRRRDAAPAGRCEAYDAPVVDTGPAPQPAGPGLSPAPTAAPAPEGPSE